MYLRRNFESGRLIHEIAYVIEENFNIYRDKKCIKMVEDIICDYETYSKSVFLSKSSSLISEYRGRVYEDIEFFKRDNKSYVKTLDDFLVKNIKNIV